MKKFLALIATAMMTLSAQAVEFDFTGKASDLSWTEVTEHSFGYAYSETNTNKAEGTVYLLTSAGELDFSKYQFYANTNSTSIDATSIQFKAKSGGRLIIAGLGDGDEVTVKMKEETVSFRNMTGTSGMTITQNDVTIGQKEAVANNTAFTVSGTGNYVSLEVVQYDRVYSVTIKPSGASTKKVQKTETFDFASMYDAAITEGALTVGSAQTIAAVYNNSTSADDENKKVYAITQYGSNALSGKRQVAVTNNKEAKLQPYFTENGMLTGASYVVVCGLEDGDVVKLTPTGSGYNFANATTSAMVAKVNGETMVPGTTALGKGSTHEITIETAGDGYLVLQGNYKTSCVQKLEVVYIVEEEVLPTGIENVQKKTLQSDGRMYNMHGMEVTNPQKGQLYIMNGKKYLAR